MADEQNGQQPQNPYDPNAASYVPNSPEYQAAQAQQAQPANPYAQAEQVAPVQNPYGDQQPVQAQNPYYGATPQPTYQPQFQQSIPTTGEAYQAPENAYAQPNVYQAPASQVPPSGYPGQAPQQPPYGYQSPQGVPYQQPMYNTTPVKDHSTSSKVLGILSIIAALFSPLVAWILGGIGLTFASQDKKNFGDDRSKVGRICSIVGIALGVASFVLSFLLLMSGMSDSTF